MGALAYTFLSCLEVSKGFCSECHHACHKNSTFIKLDPNKAGKLANLIDKYSRDKINYSLFEEKYPYYINIKIGEYQSFTRPMPTSVFEGNGRECIAYRYENDPNVHKEMKPKMVSRRIITDVRRYEEVEPVYETETKYRTETYQETVYKRVSVTKTRRVNKPYIKSINKPMYNNYTHRMEDRWYTEYYDDVSYENYTDPETVPIYVTKERTVPYIERKLIGTRTVLKEDPVYKTIEREELVPVKVYKARKITYDIGEKSASCDQCKCIYCDNSYISAVARVFMCCIPSIFGY